MVAPTLPPVARKKPKLLGVIRAVYVASVARAGEVPAGPPEIAFVGRSNVGKSSLINALCRQKALARTSKLPGRTQAVNLFDADLNSGQTIRFVDLPGFGHANIAKSKIATFSEMIQYYLLGADHMRLVVLLQDARRDRDDDAIGFAAWLRENKIPYTVVATKGDEISANLRMNVAARLQCEFHLAKPAPVVSAFEKWGIDELLYLLK